MPHITLPDSVPGIRSLVIYRPETGKYLYELVQILLRGESSLPAADRELIAAYVSYLNNCDFCYQSHAAAARCLYGEQQHLVDLAVEKLSHREKLVFTLSRKDGLNRKEIAQQLGVSENTVRNHLYNALINIRKHLSKMLKSMFV